MILPSRIYSISEKAIVIEWEQRIEPRIAGSIRLLQECIYRAQWNGLVELVPSYASLSVFYNPIVVKSQGHLPGETAAEKAEAFILQLLTQTDTTTIQAKPRRVEIPVLYGGAHGPDLSFVAAHCKMTEAEVIDLHSKAIYQVYLLGFVPGFAYLGGMNTLLDTPRKQTPRPNVPAGSVGIAGLQTGIYPMQITGGWQIIGSTTLSLFNPGNTPPAFLQAGDEVCFVPVTSANT
ncbi:inhibitor of KinA [Filimonas lacunae]|uniref:Inhibitor of KinA n=1 Tax=Filimonas lacunae TaxID=477680 RepID=A0A173MQJ3_9BACT|nr:5-oxoprolinase subunit PxpB [Filimonas lacunae]BAV09720.1 allophanate hydrolase 2 subunit 1 [Filimonas lacunae]SIS77824.1 inhibitor of KinA [Filimonas lacunae]